MMGLRSKFNLSVLLIVAFALLLPAVSFAQFFFQPTAPLPAGGTTIVSATVAKYFRLIPQASDSIYINGSTSGDGKYIGVVSTVVGRQIDCKAFQTGAAAYDWACWSNPENYLQTEAADYVVKE